MTHARRIACLLLAGCPGFLAAQATRDSAGGICFRARPAPQCRGFPVTNAGVYVPGHVVMDYGVLFNVNPRAAVGASWLVSIGDQESVTGPMVRYRRWVSTTQSLDMALGTPVAGDLKAGSVLGALTYNPVQWFGVGVRPEYARRTVYACDSVSCTSHVSSALHVSGGAELGGLPGLVATLVGGAAFVALFIALIGSMD